MSLYKSIYYIINSINLILICQYTYSLYHSNMIQIIMPKTFISNYGIFQKIASIKNTSISSILSLIKTNIPVYHRSTIKNRKNRHNLQNLQSRQNLLHKYKSIKKKESSKPTENKNNLV
jgi:hypothetical protein